MNFTGKNKKLEKISFSIEENDESKGKIQVDIALLSSLYCIQYNCSKCRFLFNTAALQSS